MFQLTAIGARKPNVHGSIFQFEGQATVFYPNKGPCYRCLFPEPPPPGAAPSCAEAGVLGVLPGTWLYKRYRVRQSRVTQGLCRKCGR